MAAAASVQGADRRSARSAARGRDPVQVVDWADPRRRAERSLVETAAASQGSLQDASCRSNFSPTFFSNQQFVLQFSRSTLSSLFHSEGFMLFQ